MHRSRSAGDNAITDHDDELRRLTEKRAGTWIDGNLSTEIFVYCTITVPPESEIAGEVGVNCCKALFVPKAHSFSETWGNFFF